ncbi:C40 family peptidase [Bacillus sp. FJAT-29790]|uniref:C40 family peptidase n=1 Tax=Bacillus sp. FJAT-29790 TaxID=1895002 RepID=UPI001C21469B|nr:C40 family peptidase [Bacillus sp. FJAT-29790]MBU8880427.1 C40 family peptidase [Bacillus sp. FJAT-29790]
MASVSVKKSSFVLALVTALAVMFSSLFGLQAEAAQTKGQQVASYAQKFTGSPFKYGGTKPNGFDASGFTQYVYANSLKVKLHRTSADQYKLGTSVKVNQLQPGDLVFYQTNGKSVSFVAVYIGNQQFVGATSNGVKVQSMNSAYWKNCYVGAKRIIK